MKNTAKYAVLSFFSLAIVLICLNALKVYNLYSTFCDLGIFEQHFWNIVYNHFWQRAFWGHVQPLMLIESIGYLIFPSAFFLVFLQSVLIALPLLWFPAFLSSVCETSLQQNLPYTSCLNIFLLAYILYFPVWFNALFDFHMDHLIIPLGFLFYFFCFKQQLFWATLTAMSIVLIKEPFALFTSCCGIYLIIRGFFPLENCVVFKKNDVENCRNYSVYKPFLYGIFLFVFGLGYFYFATQVISPYFTHGIRVGFDSDVFSWMGNSPVNMVIFIVSHPLVILREIFGTPMKVVYLTAVFGALAFVPLLSPLELIPALPILTVSLLSRVNNYYGLGNHYTAGLIAPCMVAFIVGLPRAEKIWVKCNFKDKYFRRVLISCLVLVNVLLSPSPVSRLFWTNKIWGYGINAYISNDRNRIIKQAIIDYIPEDSKIVISVQNTINYSYLNNRDYAFPFPLGVFKDAQMPDFKHRNKTIKIQADFVVLDLKRPWFIIDKSCNWIYGKCTDTKRAAEFMKLVDQVSEEYKKIFSYDGFMIFKLR